ncbi:MAG: type II toxin-antitoxin system VapC family toxin [Sphingomonadaceae bacterium]|nr:type II toxin-antitoxin system VapC family toxin [Sphingomonadaceae bacterium]
MILVDTNVWSELTKSTKNPKVDGWLRTNQPDLVLSSIVIAEIRFGIELPQGASRRAALESWLAGLESQFADRMLSFDRASAHVFGLIAAKRRADLEEAKILDMQIAAQAIAHGMDIATRNVRDFEWTGVAVIDPWRA